MSSGLLVIPGVSTLPCVTLMSLLKTIILKYVLVCVFLVSPCCGHRDRRPDQTVSVVPSPRFVLFVFSSVLFDPVFVSLAQESPHRREPSCSPFAEFSPPFAALPSRGSREFTPPFAALPSRGSRDFMPPFAAQPSRRSWEFTPPFADQPAHSSQEMTPPSTANLAHRPAADSMPAGLPLTQCPPACLWLKLSGLPLTQARRIAADSSSPDCRWLMPAGRRWQGKPTHFLCSRRRLRLTDPAVRGRSRRRPWGKPTHRRRLPLVSRGKPTRRPRTLGPQPAEAPSSPPAPAVVWSSPPAAAIICQASRLWYPQTAAAVLTSQPAVAVFDQTVTTVFLTVYVCLAPEGSWYPWASPRKFWGGVVGLRPKRLRWGLGPRSRRRSHHGLPSSLLHLDLGLSVPLWRPRPVYVSVSVLWGLQSAHPPSLVVLLRHGTCLPGGGSYVRDLSCASVVPSLLFLYLVCFLSVVIIVYSCHLLC